MIWSLGLKQAKTYLCSQNPSGMLQIGNALLFWVSSSSKELKNKKTAHGHNYSTQELFSCPQKASKAKISLHLLSCKFKHKGNNNPLSHKMCWWGTQKLWTCLKRWTVNISDNQLLRYYSAPHTHSFLMSCHFLWSNYLCRSLQSIKRSLRKATTRSKLYGLRVLILCNWHRNIPSPNHAWVGFGIEQYIQTSTHFSQQHFSTSPSFRSQPPQNFVVEVNMNL